MAITSNSPCQLETGYHCVNIEADPTHLEYTYARWVADAIDGRYPGHGALDGVFVGGGAFTLPR